MRQISKIIFLIFISTCIVVSFNTCNKDNRTIKISGLVTDGNQHKSLSGVKVTILSNKITSGVFNPDYTEITHANTDVNGKFSMDIKVEKTGGYRFMLFKQNYFDVKKDFAPDVIEAKDEFSTSFVMNPVANIEVRARNANPVNQDDYIAWSFKTGTQNCYQCCPPTVYKGYGENYDQTVNCKTIGNRYVVINWLVTKFNQTINYTDSVFCPAFQTTAFSIDY